VQPTIIIPTKDRCDALSELLDSIERLDAVDGIVPEIIVADNDSQDDTCEHVEAKASCFRAPVRTVKVTRPGKSAAINDALKVATGDVLAFLDDDVVVDKSWLTAIEDFFRAGQYQVGQGIIRLPAPDKDDAEVLRLVERYRTIPKLEFKKKVERIHSLNGANFFALREVFDRVGGFDERLGPGASGTSEDVEFARRLTNANIAIGYAPAAVVYHRVDRSRLTEEYFQQSHRRQGKSRFLMRKRSIANVVFNLARAAGQYAYHSVAGSERDRYRSKGRIYHYLGMMEARQNHRR
jgi:glycosyltransferase involved in cell wall biosynthesis